MRMSVVVQSIFFTRIIESGSTLTHNLTQTVHTILTTKYKKSDFEIVQLNLYFKSFIF